MSSGGTKSSRWREPFEVGTTVAMLVLAAIFVWQGGPWLGEASVPQRTPPIPAELISIIGRPAFGAPTATVALIEYSDYECEFCAKVARETMPVLVQEYVTTGKVQIVLKHMPLDVHQFARDAAIAGTCAEKQGRFWQMHDQIFAQAPLSHQRLRASADAAELDLLLFDACLEKGDALRIVEADRAEARRLGITGTPTFFIGLRQGDGQVRVQEVLSGAKPVEAFRAILDRVLN